MNSPEKKLALQFHETLNPVFWVDNVLRPEIRDKMLEIVEAFLESIDTSLDVEDITFTGSLANYNYTVYSDVDLHILTDLSDFDVDKEFITDYFKAKKTIWNDEHNIKIKGYDVEVYVQDTEAEHYSTGVYSIKQNKWLSIPSKNHIIDQQAVVHKIDTMIEMIAHALDEECSAEVAEAIKEKILKARQTGLERGGEFSVENLAFKELRRNGYIEKLIQGTINKKDKDLSIKQETFKQLFSIDTRERGPRHQKLNAGVRKLVNPNAKTVGMVAKCHSVPETPFPHIERLKAKKKGMEFLSAADAQKIANFYSLNLNKARSAPLGLSTSGISIRFNPTSNNYILTK